MNLFSSLHADSQWFFFSTFPPRGAQQTLLMFLSTVSLYSDSISAQSVLQWNIHLVWGGGAEAEGCCSQSASL